MATYEQAMAALRMADAAGNVEDAQKLAAIAAKLKPETAKETASAENPRSLKNLLGAATEPLLSLASGSLALPISGLAGIASGGDADVIKSVQEGLTYQPRTTGGQNAMSVVGYPFEKLAQAGNYLGEQTTDITGLPALGAAANTATQVLPTVLAGGLLSTKGTLPGSKYIRAQASKLIPERTSTKILRSAAGKDLDQVMALTQNAPDNLTAAQAAAPLSNDVWNALGELAKKNDMQGFYSKLAESQKQARLDSMKELSGSTSQAGSKQSIKVAKKDLGKVTGPMFEAEKTLANQGLKPIDTNKIISDLEAKISDPKIGADPLTEKVLTDLVGQIKEWTDKGNGVIDAHALHLIRQNGVNFAVDKIMGPANPKYNAERSAGILNNVKPLIDQAIIDAGGTKWLDALKAHAKGMNQINQQRLAAKATLLLKESPRKFESLMEGDKPKIVEDIFKTEYDVKRAMGPKSFTMQRVADELTRDRFIKEGATRGEGGLTRVLEKNMPSFKMPNWISRNVAITNRALDIAESHISKKAMNEIYKAMESGGNAYNILAGREFKKIPKTQREIIANELLRASAVTGGLLSPSQ